MEAKRQRMVQLVDLDGCIADDRWRRDFILPGAAGMKANVGFHTYHSQCWRDEIMNRTMLLPDTSYIVLTARPVRYHSMTQHWLYMNNIFPIWTLHRNNDDARPSVDVKREMVGWLLDSNLYSIRLEDIRLAIDDREDILKMYEEFGIRTTLVRIGEVEHDEGR